MSQTLQQGDKMNPYQGPCLGIASSQSGHELPKEFQERFYAGIWGDCRGSVDQSDYPCGDVTMYARGLVRVQSSRSAGPLYQTPKFRGNAEMSLDGPRQALPQSL